MKKTRTIFAIAAGISLMGVAIAQAGDITESRDLSAFDKITIDNMGVGLDVRVGENFSVTLKGTEKWAKKIFTSVDGDTLVIERKDKSSTAKQISSDNRVIVTMPEFSALTVNGAVDANLSGIEGRKIDFKINGASNIKVSGKCAKLDITLNGASNFEGRKLKCEDVTVRINGVGNVEAFGAQSADLTINGMGNIDFYGNPKEIDKDKGWFSNITIHK